MKPVVKPRAVATILALSALLLSRTVTATEVYLLAIGNNYGHAGEVQLKYAERDATQMAGVFKRLGRVRATNSAVLLGDGANQIRAALGSLNIKIASLSPTRQADTVLIYSLKQEYLGKGVLHDRQQGEKAGPAPAGKPQYDSLGLLIRQHEAELA